MTDAPEDVSTAARVEQVADLPLEERAAGYETLLADLQSRLESADAAD